MRTDKMKYLTNKSARIGSAALIASILVVGICGEAAAKTHRTHTRHLQARSFLLESRAQLVPQPPARSGTMRYYGGPKSPMWRSPAEN
jgi:hypothetical protein